MMVNENYISWNASHGIKHHSVKKHHFPFRISPVLESMVNDGHWGQTLVWSVDLDMYPTFSTVPASRGAWSNAGGATVSGSQLVFHIFPLAGRRQVQAVQAVGMV